MTKHVGIKNTKEIAKYKAKKHPLINATTQEIDVFIDNNMISINDIKEAIRAIAHLLPKS